MRSKRFTLGSNSAADSPVKLAEEESIALGIADVYVEPQFESTPALIAAVTTSSLFL